MRLLMTTDTVGGVWSYTRELVNGLLRNGVSVLLMTLGRPLSESQAAWVSSATSRHPDLFRVVTTEFRLEWMEDAAGDVAASCRTLLCLTDDFRPDLLHTNQFCFASLDLPIPILLVAHSDVRSWWHAVHHCPPPETDWMRTYTQLVREAVQNASLLVAPTRWMLREIAREYGAPERACVVANGCTPSQTRSTRPTQLRAVSIGRLWDQGKNVRLLEEVYSRVPISIAGDTEPPAGSHAAVYSGAGASRCELLGPLSAPAVRELLSTSAIYVATSRYEPFGLAPLEAAMVGCAIISNDIPSLREVWEEDALYYERDDAKSLANLLDRLVADEDLRRKMAARANRRAHARYTSEIMTAAYLGLYGAELSRTGGLAHA